MENTKNRLDSKKLRRSTCRKTRGVTGPETRPGSAVPPNGPRTPQLRCATECPPRASLCHFAGTSHFGHGFFARLCTINDHFGRTRQSGTVFPEPGADFHDRNEELSQSSTRPKMIRAAGTRKQRKQPKHEKRHCHTAVPQIISMVEMVVLETTSENPSTQLSTGVSNLLGFPRTTAG